MLVTQVGLPCMVMFIGLLHATTAQVVEYGDADGQCFYKLSVPLSRCQNDSYLKLAARVEALEKQDTLHKLENSQQQLQFVELNSQLATQANHIAEQNYRITQLTDTLKQHGLEFKKYLDCSEHRLAGRNISGVFNITLEHALSPISVWCDMETEKGGWTIFQKRQDGSVYFFRDWAAYKQGFGNSDGEYYLGNDNLYHLTNQKKYLLRVDMWDFKGNHYWAEYDDFYIENELHKYTLRFRSYKGTAGDSLAHHKNRYFSTKDRDNDANSGRCSYTYKGAFWYNTCLHVNANAMYHDDEYTGGDAIFWYHIKNNQMALKKFEMKVRPMTFHRK